MGNKIPTYLLQKPANPDGLHGIRKVSLTFLDRTIVNAANAIRSIYLQAENASRQKMIHAVHPYIKLFSLIYMVVIISIAANLKAQLLATSLIFMFYVLTWLRLTQIYKQIFLFSFIFGFIIIIPASLNIITPGKIILNLIIFDRPVDFWIYHIPREIGFTLEGLRVVLLFYLRVLNSISFTMLIIYTTSFPSFIKSFKIIGIPDAFLMVISLAYKFIFILTRTIEETYFALKSRLSGKIKSRSIRKLVGGRIFFVFRKSMFIYENTYYAMVSRGYYGKVIFPSQRKLNYIDLCVMSVILVSGICIILI
jgi:cobalt/nickel transport system permease protein